MGCGHEQPDRGTAAASFAATTDLVGRIRDAPFVKVVPLAAHSPSPCMRLPPSGMTLRSCTARSCSEMCWPGQRRLGDYTKRSVSVGWCDDEAERSGTAASWRRHCADGVRPTARGHSQSRGLCSEGGAVASTVLATICRKPAMRHTAPSLRPLTTPLACRAGRRSGLASASLCAARG